MFWGGRPDELAPRDFLKELVSKIEYDDASPKGFFKFILFHLDEGMRYLAKNHVRGNLHEDERNAKLLCLFIKRVFYSIRLRRHRVGIDTGQEILSSDRLVFGLAVGPAALKQTLNVILNKIKVENCRHVRFDDDILVIGNTEQELDSWENLVMIETKKCGFEIPEVKIVRPTIGQKFRWLGNGHGIFRKWFRIFS